MSPAVSPCCLAEYEYIEVWSLGSSPSGKTEIYRVQNKNSTDKLGLIKWHAPWRQYTFLTSGVDAIFSAGCLLDIATFVGMATEAHKKRKP
jgi:hypothetical protein